MFNVGDRVRIKKEAQGRGDSEADRPGRNSGRVVKVSSANIVSVEWDANVGGHDCGCLTKYGHGWNVRASVLERSDDFAVVAIGDSLPKLVY